MALKSQLMFDAVTSFVLTTNAFKVTFTISHRKCPMRQCLFAHIVLFFIISS